MLLLTGLGAVVLLFLSLVRVEGQPSLKVFGVLCNGGGGRKGDEIKHLTLIINTHITTSAISIKIIITVQVYNIKWRLLLLSRYDNEANNLGGLPNSHHHRCDTNRYIVGSIERNTPHFPHSTLTRIASSSGGCFGSNPIHFEIVYKCKHCVVHVRRRRL